MTFSKLHVLQLLRCLHTESTLRWADPQLLARINQAITDSALMDLDGTRLDRQLEKVLVNEDDSLAYVVVNNIYRMVAGQAVRLSQLEQTQGVDE